MGMGGNGNGNGFMGMGVNRNRNSPSRTPLGETDDETCYVDVWLALRNPGARHVCILSAADQVRRPSSLQLAQERQSRRRGTLPLCRRRL